MFPIEKEMMITISIGIAIFIGFTLIEYYSYIRNKDKNKYEKENKKEIEYSDKVRIIGHLIQASRWTTVIITAYSIQKDKWIIAIIVVFICIIIEERLKKLLDN